ncbi:MAG: glutamyl-tRNA reductase, partial [Dehalococcoidia bacterium]
MIRALTAGHRECPAELRERLAARWDRGLLPPASAAGTVVLSTCNRFEVYVSTEAGHGDEAAKSLRSIAGVESEPGVRELLGGEAVRHLFRVSSGLESMVLGEAEILGQVRRAYTAAVEAGTVDQTLSHLFHEALRVGRRARRATGIGKRRRSVPALAARAAATHVESLADVHPLILGTGEAAVLAARAFSRLGAASPVFLSTDEGRARTVAAAEGGCGDGLARLEKRLQGSDIVVAARGRGVPDITALTVRRSQAARGSRAAVIVDL